MTGQECSNPGGGGRKLWCGLGFSPELALTPPETLLHCVVSTTTGRVAFVYCEVPEDKDVA